MISTNERSGNRPSLPSGGRKVVAIDVDRGEYAVADNALTASESLLARHTDAEIWCVRVGLRVLHRIGGSGDART